MTILSMPADIYAQLRGHLGEGEMEQVAFLFADAPDGRDELRASDVYLVPPEGFEFQSDYHVSLTDEVRALVIKRAWDRGGTLVEVHSHCGGPPAWFSGSDLHGSKEWVPHVRWRLRGRPYVALVFAHDAFDALVWEGAGQAPSVLESLIVDGDEPRLPSGLTYDRIRNRS